MHDDERIQTWPDRYYRRALFEGYFIRKKYVKLTLPQLRMLPGEYAGKLLVLLIEMDKIVKEEQDKEAAKARRT